MKLNRILIRASTITRWVLIFALGFCLALYAIIHKWVTT